MKTRKRVVDIVIFVLLLGGSVLMLYPFLWMIFTSFHPHLHVYIGGLLAQVWAADS